MVNYVVNYEYIRTELCVNKEKPKLECNGKCHLKKELAKASEKDSPISQNKKTTASEVEVLFYQDFLLYEKFLVFSENKSTITAHYSNLYLFDISDLIFHPPILQS